MIKQACGLNPQGTHQGNEIFFLCRRPAPENYILLMCVALLLGGCADLTSIFRTYDAKETSIVIDAKQRTIISRNGKVCAEPSPDALSALSANASITGSYLEKFTAYLTGSTAESATSIGLRTQTIQLLRDGMYRLCEGHMMDALDDIQFARLQRRYQNVMLGLLSIEQMTGAVTPQPVILESQSGSNSTNDVVKIQEQVIANRKTIEATEGEITKAQAKLDEAKKATNAAKEAVATKTAELEAEGKTPSTPPKEATLMAEKKKLEEGVSTKKTEEQKEQENVNKLKQELKDYQENQEILENALKNSRNVASKASAAGTFGTPFQTNRLSNDIAEHVTKAVTAIVKDVLKVDRDYLVETCLTLLSDSITPKTNLFNALKDKANMGRNNKATDMVNYCAKLLQKDEADTPSKPIQSASNNSTVSPPSGPLGGPSSESAPGPDPSVIPSEIQSQTAPAGKSTPPFPADAANLPTQPAKKKASKHAP